MRSDTAAPSPGLWLPAALVVVGAVLRFYRLGGNSLWADEFMTLSVARLTPGEIMRTSSSLNFIPPLYFLIVHGAVQVLGESEAALRAVSAVAGVCTIPVVWLLTETMTGSRSTANVTGGLLAINPLHLWYSQEARPYALLTFFGCSSLLFLAQALRYHRLPYWIGFSVCGTLTILTHTTGLLIGLIAWIWALWGGERSRVIRPLAASSLAIGLACAPALHALAGALQQTHMTFHSDPRPLTGLEIPYTLFTYVAGYSFGPGPRDIQNLGPLAALRAHLIQAGIAVVTLSAVLITWWMARRRAMTEFLALFCVQLVGILALSAWSGKAYNVRYTLPAVVGFVGMVGVAVYRVDARARGLLLSTVGGVALLADAQWYWCSRYAKEDSRAAVQWLRDNLASGATVAVAPSYSVGLLEYYAGKAGARLHFVPAPANADSGGGTSPHVLLLTRLHHVPNWRELKADFLRQAGVRVRDVQVVGYEILVGSEAPTRLER